MTAKDNRLGDDVWASNVELFFGSIGNALNPFPF